MGNEGKRHELVYLLFKLKPPILTVTIITHHRIINDYEHYTRELTITLKLYNFLFLLQHH